MFQIITVIQGERLEGKVFESEDQAAKAVLELAEVYTRNNFPAECYYEQV